MGKSFDLLIFDTIKEYQYLNIVFRIFKISSELNKFEAKKRI